MESRQPVRGVSLVEAVYAALRSDILAREIAPGESLTELGIAQKFEIARPTAKAAMERLAAEGLLDRTMHRSARVPVLTGDEVQDVFSVRELLEVAAVRMLAESAQVPRAAEQALREMEAADDRRDVGVLVEADVAFHRALVQSSGSARLDRAHVQIMGEAQLAIVQDQVLLTERAVGVASEHRAILEAIRSGDPDRAAAEVSQHLASVSSRLSEPN